MKNGHGRYYYSNGNFYDGQWKNDRKHGRGEYKYLLTKENYKGEWRNGQKDGRGIFTFSYNDYYDGQFEKGLKSGRGKIVFQSGA